MIYENVIDLIGNTPLVSLKGTTGMNIYAKAEFLNPGGSICLLYTSDAADD